jgi:hypothetical protein
MQVLLEGYMVIDPAACRHPPFGSRGLYRFTAISGFLKIAQRKHMISFIWEGF